MNRLDQIIVMTGVATLLTRLGTTDEMFTFVKPGMRPWILATGFALGLLSAVRAMQIVDDWLQRRDSEKAGMQLPEFADEHRPPRLAYLLVLPLLVVVVLAPPPLNSYAASRQPARVQPVSASSFGAMTSDETGRFPLTVGQFNSRARYDDSKQMAGKPLSVTGFVVHKEGSSNEFLLTRFAISCCAADAYPVQVRVEGLDGSGYSNDTWVVIEGEWRDVPLGPKEQPVLTASSITQVDAPAEQYEPAIF